jgi:omega-6 fatty acid desaturase (delta-12 desaturase)
MIRVVGKHNLHATNGLPYDSSAHGIWKHGLESAKNSMRDAKELLIASKEFAQEYRWRSWFHLWSAIVVLAALLTGAISDLPFGIRLLSSLLAGLVGVRMFIIYHDFQHGAILRDAPLATFVMTAYGLITLNPPSVWNRSHEHHHKHNSKSFGASIGSYPIMTTEAYANATSSERFAYGASRHPITILLGYLSVFLWGMSLRPFLQNPRKHLDGLFAMCVHFGLVIFLLNVGTEVFMLGMAVPLFVASSLGAYLFYAQHNYPAAIIKTRSEWSHVDAALYSSCFVRMGPAMNWFTGNIGYHHVHHLNARIPFYRLPEAMAAIEELQQPGTTTLRPKDIVACLRLKLWSPEQGKFVGFEAAA